VTWPHRDLILIAALDLPPTFTREDLVVAAWRKFPEAFGLTGYALPSAIKVDSKCFGARGLLAKLLLEREGARWALTPAGRKRAMRLAGSAPPSTPASPPAGT
jgi:hypothetical protein